MVTAIYGHYFCNGGLTQTRHHVTCGSDYSCESVSWRLKVIRSIFVLCSSRRLGSLLSRCVTSVMNRQFYASVFFSPLPFFPRLPQHLNCHTGVSVGSVHYAEGCLSEKVKVQRSQNMQMLFCPVQSSKP